LPRGLTHAFVSEDIEQLIRVRRTKRFEPEAFGFEQALAMPGYTAAIVRATTMKAVVNFAIALGSMAWGPRSSGLWNRALPPMTDT